MGVTSVKGDASADVARARGEVVPEKRGQRIRAQGRSNEIARETESAVRCVGRVNAPRRRIDSVVNRATGVFLLVINAIAAPDYRVLAAKRTPRESEPRSPICRISELQ